ncbi:hypothetical protein [Actinomycetospora soli]|uniref:hypothetical protein n=1 Tax=Actinomycetospora soli TaxID=2893887 RepID=UPI001E4E4D78|nr:hypothetical protein [Actinomycetospora soli]MCD2186838.1 hypothetical protein [Actinomycetospora soli]
MTEPAECSLLDFLDGPEAEPSVEWVAAAINREPSERAEEALVAQQRAEAIEERLVDLRARRPSPLVTTKRSVC